MEKLAEQRVPQGQGHHLTSSLVRVPPLKAAGYDAVKIEVG